MRWSNSSGVTPSLVATKQMMAQRPIPAAWTLAWQGRHKEIRFSLTSNREPPPIPLAKT